MALSHVAIARAANQSFAFDQYMGGSIMTSSESHWVPDMSSGSTALSCGLSTNNKLVGVVPNSDGGLSPCGTLLEAAMSDGRAVGVVTNGLITAPIVASWLTHSRSPDDAVFIANKILTKLGLDLVFGGGDEVISRLKSVEESFGWNRVSVDDVVEEKNSTDTGSKDIEWPVLGVFARRQLSFAIDRELKSCNGMECPSLKEMTKSAIEMLSKNSKFEKKGMALAVFNARLGTAARNNDIAAVHREIQDLNDAFKIALEFQREEGNEKTLIVVVSPYEAGGLVFGRDSSFDSYPEDIVKIERSIPTMVSYLDRANSKDSKETQELLDHFGLTNLNNQTEMPLLINANFTAARTDALLKILNTRFGIRWTSTNPTGVDTPFYAAGFNADKLRGSVQNTDFTQSLAKLANLDLKTETKKRLSESISQS
jgi:alkaline phosphatase